MGLLKKITQKDYIRVQRKITKPQLIAAATLIAEEEGLTKEEVCYNIICKGLILESKKIEMFKNK